MRKRSLLVLAMLALALGLFVVAPNVASASNCPPGYSLTLIPGYGLHCVNGAGYDPYGRKWR